VQVGPWAFGVRSSSAETDTAIQRILAAHLLPDVEAPPNLSLLTADPSAADGPSRSFDFLYRSSQSVVRTRSPGRVLRALFQYLSDLAAPETSLARFYGTGLVLDGRSILAPYQIRSQMAAFETRLHRAGLRVVDTPVVSIDLGTGELVVPEPVLSIDAEALAEYERRHPSRGREPVPVPPGRYPILGWAAASDEDRVGRLPLAEAVATMASEVSNADVLGAQETLSGVARILGRAIPFGVWWQTPRELVSQLTDLTKEAA
jgi:hypothetical protein